MLNELTKSLSPRLLSLLLLAGATLIVSTSYSVWFKKPIKDYRQLLIQRDNLHKQPQDKQAAETEILALRQSITDLNRQLNETGREVLKGTQAINVMSDMGAYAKQYNVQLHSVTPGDAVSGERYTEVPFQVDINGKYEQLFKWIYALEHSNTPLFIREFSLRPGLGIEGRSLKLTIALIQPLKEEKNAE